MAMNFFRYDVNHYPFFCRRDHLQCFETMRHFMFRNLLEFGSRAKGIVGLRIAQ